MRKLLILPITSLFLYAGSSDAIIECKSGSGRTFLKFYDQDIQGDFNGGTFSIDKKRIHYHNNMSNKKKHVHMIVNLKEGIYNLYYEDAKHKLVFYAIPKTFKKERRKGYDSFYKFNSIVTSISTDPRKNEKYIWENQLKKDIWLGCTLKYSI